MSKTKKVKSVLREAAGYLKRHFYKKPRKWRDMGVDDVVNKYPDMSVAELIRIFFNDKHTYHDPRASSKVTSEFPKPWVEVDDGKASLTIRMGPFVGHFIGSKYEKSYVAAVQDAFARPQDGRKLIIDLRFNGGGSDKVMLRALRGVEKWGTGTVLVSRNTASAGEMVAATLIRDYGFKRRGGKTAGMLSVCKNVILSDGSFLGITTGFYKTPGGKLVKRFYV